MVLTSTTIFSGSNICLGIPSAKHDILSVLCPTKKLQNTHFLIHFYVYIILLRLTFSLDLRKPCWKLAKVCLLSQIWLCFWEKTFIILYKQNEKHPLTNYTLLASSSSPTVKVTDSKTDTNINTSMEADATSGKKTVCKYFIYNEFTFKYGILIYWKKNRKISQRYLKVYTYV